MDHVWIAAGLEPLQKRQVRPDPQTDRWQLNQTADYRLERECAPKEGEETRDGAPSEAAGVAICYTSCLLRIKLLRGEKLEPWRIYMALYSAIQRRGHDPDVPWKTRQQRRSEEPDDDEGATLARRQECEKQLTAMAPGQPQFQWPC